VHGGHEGGDVSAPDQEPESEPAEVLFEFTRIGNSVKVSATDPRSLVEVAIVGDPGMGEAALRRIATRKLAYVLRRAATKRL
jgi:hypothetical protein